MMEMNNEKMPYLGIPTWAGFGNDISKYTGKSVKYRMNSSIEDLQNALLHGKLPVVAVAWESDSKLISDSLLDAASYAAHGGAIAPLTIGHYMVAVGFDKNSIYFLDPGNLSGLTKYTNQQWSSLWSNSNYFVQPGSMWTISP